MDGKGGVDMSYMTSDFETIFLRKSELKLMKRLDQGPVICTPGNETLFIRLFDLQFIIGLPEVGTRCERLSKRGEAYLVFCRGKKYAERKADIKYWITTAIAVAALVKSFLPEISAATAWLWTLSGR